MFFSPYFGKQKLPANCWEPWAWSRGAWSQPRVPGPALTARQRGQLLGEQKREKNKQTAISGGGKRGLSQRWPAVTAAGGRRPSLGAAPNPAWPWPVCDLRSEGRSVEQALELKNIIPLVLFNKCTSNHCSIFQRAFMPSDPPEGAPLLSPWQRGGRVDAVGMCLPPRAGTAR